MGGSCSFLRSDTQSRSSGISSGSSWSRVLGGNWGHPGQPTNPGQWLWDPHDKGKGPVTGAQNNGHGSKCYARDLGQDFVPAASKFKLVGFGDCVSANGPPPVYKPAMSPEWTLVACLQKCL